MNRVLLVVAFATCFTLFQSSSFADGIFSGDTTGGPTLSARPSSFTATSSTNVPYFLQPFFVSASGEYVMELSNVVFDSGGGSSASWDAFSLIYEGSFDDTNPLDNLIAGDDDFQGTPLVLPGTDVNGTLLFGGGKIALGEDDNFGGVNQGLFLTEGTQYFAVITGNGSGDSGTFDAGIGAGPGDVTLGFVPEPSGAVVMSLVGLLALRRRSRV